MKIKQTQNTKKTQKHQKQAKNWKSRKTAKNMKKHKTMKITKHHTEIDLWLIQTLPYSIQVQSILAQAILAQAIFYVSFWLKPLGSDTCHGVVSLPLTHHTMACVWAGVVSLPLTHHTSPWHEMSMACNAGQPLSGPPCVHAPRPWRSPMCMAHSSMANSSKWRSNKWTVPLSANFEPWAPFLRCCVFIRLAHLRVIARGH